MSKYPNNPGPLPASKLRNRYKPSNPSLGRGALGNQRTGKMYFSGSERLELVKILQTMLKTLGYDLGICGPNKDGIDGCFGDVTEKAVIDFQKKNIDWDGNPLDTDGLVGPRTSDALNRAMIGIWYDEYQAPKELIKQATP